MFVFGLTDSMFIRYNLISAVTEILFFEICYIYLGVGVENRRYPPKSTIPPSVRLINFVYYLVV